jgi:hypothetical protein
MNFFNCHFIACCGAKLLKLYGTLPGAVQCLVQLSTLPVAVCYGSGQTSKDAQAAAARSALEYLKIMTKK